MKHSNSEYIQILAIAIFLIIFTASFQNVIFKEGLIEYADFTVPYSVENYVSLYYPLWNPLGSYSSIQYTPRLSTYGLILLIASTTNLGIGTLEKFLALFPLVLSFISMYIAARFLIKKTYKKFDEKTIVTISFISSFIYALNPWVVSETMHFSLIWGYAFVPLMLTKFMTILEKQSKFKHHFALAVLLSLSSITPHWLIFNFFILFSWFLYETGLQTLKKDWAKIASNILKCLKLLAIYLSLNLFWIIPTFISSLQKPLEPSYVLTHEVVYLLSRNAHMTNVIRLISSWWPQVSWSIANHTHLWIASSFILPWLAGIGILSKRKHAMFFSLVLTITLLLGMGTREPFSLFYQWLVFSSPIISNIGWVFRNPERWAAIVALSFSFLAVFGTSEIYQKTDKICQSISFKKHFLPMATALILIFYLYAYPTINGYSTKVLEPINIPHEYYRINQQLQTTPGDYKVIWMSPEGSKRIWSNDHLIGDFDTLSSNKPTIGKFATSTRVYLNYLFSECLLSNRTSNLAKYLSPLNTRYIIYHDDVVGTENEAKLVVQNLGSQNNIVLLQKENFLYLYESSAYTNYVNIPRKSVFVTGGLEITTSLNAYEAFSPKDFSLCFPGVGTEFVQKSDLIITKNNPYNAIIMDSLNNAYVIAPFTRTVNHNPSILWSKATSSDMLHGPWHYYLENREIDNWDFDYGMGLVLTWASSVLEEPPSLEAKDLISKFDFEDKNFANWYVSAENIQTLSLSDDANEGAYSLKAELYNSTWGWKTMNSPFIPAKYGNSYKWQFYAKGENSQSVHAKIYEYDENRKLITGNYMIIIGGNNFDWKKNSFNFAPTSTETAYMQLQIWHGHETKQPLPNKIWIDDVKIYDLADYLKPNTLEMPFTTSTTEIYDLYIRYFQNKDGGKIAIYLDGEAIEAINTKDQTNSFVWKKIDTYNLERGKHILTLENKEGLNAVNLFALIPQEEIAELEDKIESMLQNKNIIYVLEAESDMYLENSLVSNKYGGGASNGEVLELTSTSRVWNDLEIIKPGNYTLVIRAGGNLNIKIDEKGYITNSTELGWTYLGPLCLEKGKHEIEITPLSTHYSQWNFENGKLQEWQGNMPEMQTLSLGEKTFEGSYSLEAELNASTWGWKVVQSPIIPVTLGSVYKFDFYVAAENSQNVHAKIFEYDISNKSISGHYMASIGTGNFTWKNISFEYVPSQNASYINLQIWHGHETKQPLPNKIWIDDVRIYGYQRSDLDVVWFYSTQEENVTLDDILTPNETPAEITSYHKIDPTKFVVEVNATKPFMLSFAEAYDPLWIAYVNGEKMRSIPLYSVINGFWVNHTGKLEVTIEYEPQQWFNYGLILSVIAFLACLVCLTYNCTKSRLETNKNNPSMLSRGRCNVPS